MQQTFFRTFRYVFNTLKGIIYLVFMVSLLKDLSDAPHLFPNQTITLGLAFAAVGAALLFFDRVIDILLQVGLIALLVLVAHGYCSSPNLSSGVQACVATAGRLSFDAITDVIHRLLWLFAPHSPPELFEYCLLGIAITPSAPAT
jgi:hypothetical protein